MDSKDRFIHGNECLVSISDTVFKGKILPPTYVDYRTYIAKIINHNVSENTYEVLLLTDGYGNYQQPIQIIVGENSIVSNKKIKDINYKYFYKYTTDGNINAERFVDVDYIDDDFVDPVKSLFGSGIYGIYVPEGIDPSTLKTSANEIIYKISTAKPFILQDKHHGDNLIIASLQTNIYVHNMLITYHEDLLTYGDDLEEKIYQHIVDNNVDNLVNLWNMVLYRQSNAKMITRDWLEMCILNYVLDFYQNTITDVNKHWQLLPINSVITEIGYDGILSDDRENNTPDRGCVSYDLTKASSII